MGPEEQRSFFCFLHTFSHGLFYYSDSWNWKREQTKPTKKRADFTLSKYVDPWLRILSNQDDQWTFFFLTLFTRIDDDWVGTCPLRFWTSLDSGGPCLLPDSLDLVPSFILQGRPETVWPSGFLWQKRIWHWTLGQSFLNTETQSSKTKSQYKNGEEKLAFFLWPLAVITLKILTVIYRATVSPHPLQGL